MITSRAFCADSRTASGRLARLGWFATTSLAAAYLHSAVALATPAAATFNIEPMPADKALQLYSKQSNYQVIYDFDVVKTVKINSVNGSMAPEQALQQMLEGTGLGYHMGKDNIIVIQPQRDSALDGAGQPGYRPAGMAVMASAATPQATATDATPAAAASQASPARPLGVEEIVITATKRETRLQDTAISITAFTAEDLRASGVQDTWDLMMRTPGMTLSRNGTHAHLYIRGVGSDILGIGNEPSSAVYMDGVYLGRSQSAVTTLLDTERVEVVRGPQGTLYGRNVVGGALILVSKRPTPEFSLEGGAEFGNYDKMRFSGAINAGLVEDKLSARLAFVKDDRDGFIRNLMPGADPDKLDGIDRYGFRGAIAADLSDNFDWVVSVDYIKDDGDGPPFKVLTPGLANDLGAVFNPDELYRVRLDINNFREIENWGVQSTASWDLGPVITKAIIAYRENFWFQMIDSDSTELAQQYVTWGEDQEQFSAELQFLSNHGGPFEWVGGLYYFWENSVMSADLFQPLFGFSLALPSTNKTNAVAVFGQGSYAITDNLKLTAGLRYSWERKNHQANLFIMGFPAAVIPGRDSWDAFTPKFGLDYHVSEDVLFYVSATRGFKSGGFNSLGGGEQFEPEYIWSYEVGLKSQWWDNRLLLNLSAFHYDYTNLQVTRWTQNVTVVENAASAKVWGGEIEATAMPVEDLVLSLGVSVLDAHYNEYETFNPAFPDQGLVNLSGNRLRNAPSFTFNSSVQYSWPVANDFLITARGEYQYQSKVYFNPFNEADLSQKGYDLVNVRLSFGDVGGRWEVAAYGRNLFKEKYVTNIIRLDSTGYNALGTVGMPRTYGIEISGRF